MVMGNKESIERKKNYAKLLYTVEGVTVGKELAERVGVSTVTISKWINSEDWEHLRASVIITKESELRRLYMQITELNDTIFTRPKGERFASNKEADTLIKLTAAVKQLETDTSIAEAIEVVKKLINHIRQDDYKKAQEVTVFADAFIKSLLK